MNGKSAQTTIYIAGLLLLALVVSITLIVMSDNPVPPEFSLLMSTLAGGLVGFLAGSRVVPPDVSAEIKTQPLNQAEKEILERKNDAA